MANLLSLPIEFLPFRNQEFYFKMLLKQKIRKSLIHAAFTLNFPPAKKVLSSFTEDVDKLRQQIFERYNITVVFDVGANIGQYAKCLQHSGYKGRIISFEPLNNEREILSKSAKLFNNWVLLPFAVGDFNQKSVINISGNSASSSVLKMKLTHETAAPQSKFVGTQEIEVRTLDSLYGDYINKADNIYLKIDTQGYEWQVLKGAEKFLESVTGLELEMSFEQMYDGEKIFDELYGFILSQGFRLLNIRPMLTNPTNMQLLQADCIFIRVKS